ncbi:Protein of unknown function [Pseudidiomarina planktonica]|uniref:DUF3392 domain-containing protein n=1 Tax=Pseudidiomarina planktonica TaxID=1323738 RepID=A0A1Y6EZN8_9GAMM|nr:DUF3392 domain-containing protein [Pseudidiomarina planktonica]RUO65212.1 DUF3392 domain-containing protein [Pseudidiomarina planktonica]SMQ65992.1 Protein of unknown function [Pseudidiomarina planktonica]
MNQVMLELGLMIRPHLSDVAMMIMATLLVIYGNAINQGIRRQLGGMHFIFRTLLFVLICAFGYGLATVWLTPFIAGLLAQVPSIYLALVCVGIMLTLGVLAERKRQI